MCYVISRVDLFVIVNANEQPVTSFKRQDEGDEISRIDMHLLKGEYCMYSSTHFTICSESLVPSPMSL